jgi:hypothetical protein
LVPFTLNFTIMNLQYTPDMKHQGSTKFNTTEGILQRLVTVPRCWLPTPHPCITT